MRREGVQGVFTPGTFRPPRMTTCVPHPIYPARRGEQLSDRADEVYAFIQTIFQDQEGYIICGLMDQAGPRGKLTIQKDFAYPEGLEDMVEWATSFQNQDVYLSPLVYGDMRKKDGHIRRIPENAKTTHVVYQDSDSCPPEKFRLTPSIHVDSSAGRGQDYWVLTEAVPAERAANTSRRIAVAHRQDGSDPSSWSANKFLRLLGTNTRHGFPEKVTVRMDGSLYSIEEIEEKYADVQFEERPLMRLPEDVSYDDVQDLPEYASALEKLPGSFKMSLITDVPRADQDRSTLRYRLLCDLFRVPELGFEEVLAIAWHAPASQKWRDDSRNLRGLIAEAIKAQADVAFKAGEGSEVATAEELSAPVVEDVEKPKRISLLTDEERAMADSEDDFIKRYERYSAERLGAAHNPPYARMNAWMTLSGAFGDFAISTGDGKNSNFFCMGLGGSGTGKTSARGLWDRVMKEVFDQDAGWMLGSNVSMEALHEKLIERDGKTSFFSADEAHSFFTHMNNAQWGQGIYGELAKYYDGDIPPMLRVSAGRRELSGKSAKSNFNVHFMGTLKGELSLPAVLDRSMFYTGFLARFVWFVGEEKKRSREALEERNNDTEYVNYGFDMQARQWAAEFKDTRERLKRKHRKLKIPMNMSQSALKRMTDFKERTQEICQKLPDWEVLEPCITRLWTAVRRAATLLAIEDGRDEVSYRDLVLAIQAAEEWLTNLIYIVAQVSGSMWSRAVDDIERFIKVKGGAVRQSVVYTKFKDRQGREMDMQIDALIKQGRIKQTQKDRHYWLEAVGMKEE